MTYMLVRHKVADYARWKKVFDAHAAARRQAGLKLEHLLRNVEDPSEVFLMFEVEDLARARAFVNTAAARQAKEEAGVVDIPDMYILE